MLDIDINISLKGQCTSGKNSVIVTRTGKRFPSKRFVDWRKDMLEQLKPQIAKIKLPLPITVPVSVNIFYRTKDRIRRDAPGIIDAIWHLLEKAGIVSDDKFLGGAGQALRFINCGVDKNNVGLHINIWRTHEEDSSDSGV